MQLYQKENSQGFLKIQKKSNVFLSVFQNKDSIFQVHRDDSQFGNL